MKHFLTLWWRFVAKGFGWLYNELAFTYDPVSWIVSLGEWRQWQLSAIKFLPPSDDGVILELAHGTGHVQQTLIESGYRTIGLDISSAMGRITSNRLHTKRLRSQLVQASAYQLPFVDSPFAAIICTFPTSFIFQPQVLSELSRVLTPNGCAILVLGAKLNETNLLAKFLEWLYHITGQRDNSFAVDQYFSSANFSVINHEIKLTHSTVDVLVLTQK